ncbi:MAG: type IV pilin, partial [Euryarchaeota archaeon]|nr:type IV pilin [Euryarchaeota archaeon]
NNTLIDSDGGIVLDSMSQPPAPSSSLCTIRSYDYSYSKTCTFTLGSGKTLSVDLETDSWGGEIGIEITLPDGTKDTWPAGSFSSNTGYTPLKTYTDAGSYTIKVTDTYGDGGANIYALEAAGGGGYSGPDISGNTIGLSAGRVSPNAVGISAIDCASVTINSAGNSITLSDNAMVLENCDLSDDGSILSGDSATSTIGINSADGVNTVTLDGTSVSGYDTGVDMPSGTLNLMGDASLAGDSYGVYAADTTVIAVNAAVDGGATGTGLYVEDSPEVWVYPLDASGDIGVHVVNSPFRWDGGMADATTALKVDDSVGTVENMTWTSSTQIDAGANAYITSIGNSLDASKLIVDTTATIDEANLFTMDSTHLTATPTNEVALLIKSTDGTRASYVSTSFQPENMVVDGDNSDWNGGNALNPSGYAMPGVMSGDGTNDMSMTYIEGDNLYFGLTGEDLTNSDLLIYISTDGSGSTTGYNGMGGAHTLPVPANYVLWADSDSSYDLYSYGFLGWGPTSLSQDAISVDFSGSFAEISIPFSRMGGTPSQVDVVAIVQGESTADVSTVHPTQTIDSQNTLQTFSEYITVELTHNDLLTGSIADEVLVYRTYKGSSTPSVAKDYDVMIKTSADCAYDWAVTEDLSMATNANLNLDMERACPVIGTSLADITVNEDSGDYTFSLTNMADDVQDDELTMSWTSAESNLVAHDNVLVDWNQNGHDVTITPLDNQFGTMTYSFEVTDSNGLTDSKNITFAVENVNDAPVICNVDELDCMPLFSEDELYNNILPEGFGSHTKFLGDVSNATRSFIRDMANEQSPTRQVYTWGASVPSTCIAFSAEVNSINELVLTENTNNELGGTCTVTLTLSDDGAENQAATDFDVEFSVSPVNDAPVILDWNASMTDDEGRTVSVNPDNGSVNSIPWKLSVMEDDTTAENLTFSLAAMKNDVDHNDADLTWQIEPTDQCDYGNYFDATIVGDDLVLELVPDATTNGFDWEIDYLNDNGIHQIGPTGSDYCQIRLVLRDTASAPSYVPNYDTALMPIADYAQGVATQEIGIRVERVRELVADYGFSGHTGFSFNGVTNIMTGTYVPTTIDVTAGGDEGPYTYDHMLAITFHTDGHSEVEQTRYYAVPAYGTSVAITEDVYITKDTTNVWVEMDVKTCLSNPCDILAPSADRFQTDSPASHRSNNQGMQGADWSKPGQYGSNASQTSERRPLLEDSNWCNNMMSSLDTAATCAHANQPSSTFEASGQNLPTVVGTIGAGAVPSFAPSIIAVSLAGVFVSALALSGRRDEDEEEMEATIVEDELAVSPVIATILMVAITVVLSGVIYVWASSLAETDVKGVPRVTFDIEDINGSDADDGHWRISVRQSETDLATQAVEVRIMYTDASGSIATYTANLADTNDVYGFNPANSDAFVTFVDQVNKEGTRSVSTFNTGDEVYVRTHAPDGTPLEDVTITLKYAPANAQGAVLKEWTGLAYNLKA